METYEVLIFFTWLLAGYGGARYIVWWNKTYLARSDDLLYPEMHAQAERVNANLSLNRTNHVGVWTALLIIMGYITAFKAVILYYHTRCVLQKCA